MIWHKIAESKEELFSSIQNNLIDIEVGGKIICVAEHQGQLYGCAAKCPHAGGKMSEGVHGCFR